MPASAFHFTLRILTHPRFVGLVRSATSMPRIPAAISQQLRTVPTLMAIALFELASQPSQGVMLGSRVLRLRRRLIDTPSFVGK